MVHGAKMIKVAFFPPGNKEWMGGVNYFKNLLYALSTLENKLIEPIVFVGKCADEDVKKIYGLYAKIVEHPILDHKSLYWFLDKIFKHHVLESVLQKYQIDVLSHNQFLNVRKVKVVSWIPDFQHIHLPGMFSKKEIRNRNYFFRKFAEDSDRVILSSYSALNDFKDFIPKYCYKANVLQFVSQPEIASKLDLSINMQDKYGIMRKFFYIPNQFWKHKNHLVAFEAINHLKKNGINVCLVCSGLMIDYRDSEYVSTLIEYIDKNDLRENILLLGSIPYSDVFRLINESISVINPSLFEGWSSTVEECKSVGKKMILSDIDVHKEQYPEAIFFVKNDALSLATKMEYFEKNDIENSDVICLDNKKRTKCFAEQYQKIILNLYDSP